MEYVFCHNPYFNRWFSAIIVYKYIVFLKTRHNPYFNRWFSAIEDGEGNKTHGYGHNPYFNRWFSAIKVTSMNIKLENKSQSLF